METYAIELNMYDDVYWFRFAFHVKDQKDAERKAFGWARYHSFSWNEIKVRLATEEEAERSLHNEYVH